MKPGIMSCTIRTGLAVLFSIGLTFQLVASPPTDLIPGASGLKNTLWESGSYSTDDENKTAKLATETWQEYVDRLHQMKLLTDSHKEQWESGEAIQATRAFAINKIRQENRTRQVPVQRLRTERRGDKNVQVPYTEIVTQNYTVSVPYVTSQTATLELPAKGSKPDDNEHPGFLTKDGKPVAANPANPQRRPAPSVSPGTQKFNDQIAKHAKKSDETWEAYVQRLVELEAMTREQMEHWKSGNDVTLEKEFTFNTTRSERRTRAVSVTRMATETDEDGNETTKPVTENVTQAYTVMVPTQISKSGSMLIPGSGKRKDSESTRGFLDENQKPLAVEMDPVAALENDPSTLSAKLMTETWEDYLARMERSQVITAEQLEQWKGGKEMSVERTFTMVSYAKEKRVRTVQLPMTETVTDEEGNERQVTGQKPFRREYTVLVRVTRMHTGVLTIPAPGSNPDNAELAGFRDSKGNPIPANQSLAEAETEHNAQNSIPQTIPGVTQQIESMKNASIKKPDESWDAYVTRLHEAKLISDKQLAKWKSGEGFKVQHSISGTDYRTETRTRTVPVTRMRSQTVDGVTKQVPFTENVTQTYKVMIPISASKEGVFAIPAPGSKAEDATTPGLLFRDSKPERK